MTEDEAKTKVCCGPPFTEFQWGDLLQRKCIASACMAWRWELAHDGTFDTTLEGPTLMVTRKVPNFVRTPEGFCGLAGAPQ